MIYEINNRLNIVNNSIVEIYKKPLALFLVLQM